MSEQINEQELLQYITDKTNASTANIKLVLKHEQTFINNAKGEEIDGDDLVDYVMGCRDVKLDELTVENILDAEMEYLISKGLAGYVD